MKVEKSKRSVAKHVTLAPVLLRRVELAIAQGEFTDLSNAIQIALHLALDRIEARQMKSQMADTGSGGNV